LEDSKVREAGMSEDSTRVITADRERKDRSFALLFISFVATTLAVHFDLFALFDVVAASWLEGIATPNVTRWMFVWTDMASFWFVFPVTLVLGLTLVMRGEGYWVKRLAWALGGCMVCVQLVKELLRRPRPAVSAPLLELANYGFPSGHAAAATVLYGFVALLLCSYISKLMWRAVVSAGAITVITGIAFSRLYLHVHYFSDVAGGLLLGVAWLLWSFRFISPIFLVSDPDVPNKQSE
jgi:undecaprenyl-diphosphatase